MKNEPGKADEILGLGDFFKFYGAYTECGIPNGRTKAVFQRYSFRIFRFAVVTFHFSYADCLTSKHTHAGGTHLHQHANGPFSLSLWGS